MTEQNNNYEPTENWDLCKGVPFTNGYGIYNGLSGATVNSEVIKNTSFRVGEDVNMDPPIAVYDYNNPPAREVDLKYPYDGNGVIPAENIFNLTCNSFVQAVDNSNINRAWATRVAQPGDSTPTFFSPYNSSPYNINKYGQSRSDTPFGAAASPSDNLFNNGRVAFNNPSTSAGTNIAGRPYGCINGSNNGVNTVGCNLIGFCSLKPDTYCLTTVNSGFTNSTGVTYNLADYTCGSGGGTCTPLWGKDQMINPSSGISPFENILKNIFLTGNIYNFTGDTYESTVSYNYSNIPTATANTIPHCSNNVRAADKFCAVWPSLSNVKLYFGDNTTPFADGFTSTAPLGITKGWYRLEFNSNVDFEQKPLSNIIIDWGDGYEQSIPNQDSQPAVASPHVFYHNYNQNHVNTPISIEIKVYDNCGFFASN